MLPLQWLIIMRPSCSWFRQVPSCFAVICRCWQLPAASPAATPVRLQTPPPSPRETFKEFIFQPLPDDPKDSTINRKLEHYKELLRKQELRREENVELLKEARSCIVQQQEELFELRGKNDNYKICIVQQQEELIRLRQEHDKPEVDNDKKNPHLNTKQKKRLVVLWDAENVGAKEMQAAFRWVKNHHPELKSDGLRFGFGFKYNQMPPSCQAVATEQKFMWQFSNSNTKNCADIQLCVFAMNTLLGHNLVPKALTYLIVSKDRDFDVLHKGLEAAGRRVLIYPSAAAPKTSPPPPPPPPPASALKKTTVKKQF